MENLEDVSFLLNELFLPIETSNLEIKHYIEKYSSYVQNIIFQLGGTQSIRMPKNLFFKDTEDLDTEIVEEYIQCMLEWTSNIKQSIQSEKSKLQDSRKSMAIIEYWRQRNAMFSTIY